MCGAYLAGFCVDALPGEPNALPFGAGVGLAGFSTFDWLPQPAAQRIAAVKRRDRTRLIIEFPCLLA